MRISVGEAEAVVGETERVTVLETALDDLSPQVLAWVAESALAAGAMDVMLTPVIMKKGRPGTLLTILCSEKTRPALERLILRETSTLGWGDPAEARKLIGESRAAYKARKASAKPKRPHAAR